MTSESCQPLSESPAAVNFTVTSASISQTKDHGVVREQSDGKFGFSMLENPPMPIFGPLGATSGV